MRWKTEQWPEDVFPGWDAILSKYASLTPRELAITSAAVLDCALAGVLAKRFVNDENEIGAFLGLTGDGRAPCASFGARIQLARLLDMIGPEDAEILREVKSIRNLFAHRVHIDFAHPEAQRHLTRLFSKWRARMMEAPRILGAITGGAEEDTLSGILTKIAHDGNALILAVLVTYQTYFRVLWDKTVRI